MVESQMTLFSFNWEKRDPERTSTSTKNLKMKIFLIFYSGCLKMNKLESIILVKYVVQSGCFGRVPETGVALNVLRVSRKMTSNAHQFKILSTAKCRVMYIKINNCYVILKREDECSLTKVERG